MGRRYKAELKTVISVYLPIKLVTRIDSVTDNRSQFIEDMLMESMDLLTKNQLEYEIETAKLERKKLDDKIQRLEEIQKDLEKSDSEKIAEELGAVQVE